MFQVEYSNYETKSSCELFPLNKTHFTPKIMSEKKIDEEEQFNQSENISSLQSATTPIFNPNESDSIKNVQSTQLNVSIIFTLPNIGFVLAYSNINETLKKFILIFFRIHFLRSLLQVLVKIQIQQS